MSGAAAARQVLEEAQREEFIAAALVARALRCSRRQLLRDWRRRRLPITQRGHEALLSSSLVIATYFQHATPSGHSG